MSYCETTALEVVRLMLGDAAQDRRLADCRIAVIGNVSSALSESILYCGVCITIE